MNKLTDAKIRGLKGEDRKYKVSDGRGLQLLVSPAGGKAWKWAYRFDGKQRELSLGPYPEITLAEARDEVTELRRSLLAGKDPAAGRKARITGLPENAFRTVATEWWKSRQTRWKPSHATRVFARLEREIFPALGERPVNQITPREVIACLKKIEERGAIDVAKRTRQSVSAVFRYAIASELAMTNPASEIGEALSPAPRQKHHSALTEDDLPDFFGRLSAYDGDQLTALALEMVAHTFVRTAELRFATWPEFDLSKTNPMWRIPAERMKMGKEHLVPLTPQTLDIVSRIKALGLSDEIVFPGARRGFMSENTMLYALYRLGYHSRATVHGFRRTASTILNESGKFAPDWIERQLAHVEANQIRGAYNAAQWLQQRRAMMEWYSDYLAHKQRIGVLLSD